MREVVGKTLRNRYLLYGSFFIDVSSQPFEGKVYGHGRDDEGGGGEVGEMLCEEADTVLGNSLCPNIPNLFQLADVPVYEPERGVRHGAQEFDGSLSKMTRSDDDDRFVLQLLSQWGLPFCLFLGF
jgi:hypothetical protein